MRKETSRDGKCCSGVTRMSRGKYTAGSGMLPREGTAAYDLVDAMLMAEAMGEVPGDQLPCPVDDCGPACEFFVDCDVRAPYWAQFGRKRYEEWEDR